MEDKKYLFIIVAIIVLILIIFLIYYFYNKNKQSKISIDSKNSLINKLGMGNLKKNLKSSTINEFTLNEVDMKHYKKLIEIIKSDKNKFSTPINSILTKNINILNKTEEQLKKLSTINQKIENPFLFSNPYKEKNIRATPCGSIPEDIIMPELTNIGMGSIDQTNGEICDLTTRIQAKNVDVFKHYNLIFSPTLSEENYYYFTIKFGNNNILGSWINTYYPFFYDAIIDVVFKNIENTNLNQDSITNIKSHFGLQFRHPFITSLFVRDFIEFPDYENEENISLLNNKFNNIVSKQYSDFTNISIIGSNQFLISECCYQTNDYNNYDYYILSVNNIHSSIKSLCAITTYVNNDFNSLMELSNLSNKFVILERNSFFRILLIKEDVKTQSEVLTENPDSNIELGFDIKPIDAPADEIYSIYYTYLKENKFFLNETMFNRIGDKFTSKKDYKNNNFPFYYRIDETINEVAANETFFISFDWTSKEIDINTHLKNISIGDASNCI